MINFIWAVIRMEIIVMVISMWNSYYQNYTEKNCLKKKVI